MSRTYRANYRRSNRRVITHDAQPDAGCVMTRRRRPKDFLRRNYDAVALAQHFDDGVSALAFAVIFLALADLQKTALRADAERFLQGRWFETLAEGLELSPEHWRHLAQKVSAQGRAE